MPALKCTIEISSKHGIVFSGEGHEAVAKYFEAHMREKEARVELELALALIRFIKKN